jgi:thiosulfate/3-mercaptopyruvate sulfurtransferase
MVRWGSPQMPSERGILRLLIPQRMNALDRSVGPQVRADMDRGARNATGPGPLATRHPAEFRVEAPGPFDRKREYPARTRRPSKPEDRQMSTYSTRLFGVVFGGCILAPLGCERASEEAHADTRQEPVEASAVLDLKGPQLPSVLVSPEWLASNLENPELIVVDARDRKEYAQGHIPGAITLPYERTYGTDPGKESDMASLGVINDLFSSEGIDRAHTVVVYGDKADYRPPAVVFWVLEVHGHPAVAVLNGGMSGWRAGSRKVETEEAHRTRASFVASFRPERLADKLEVRRAMGDSSVVILDSRAPDEYSGEKSGPGLKRSGHIPTALNASVKKLYVDTGDACTLKDPQQLEEIYQVFRGKRVYTYCTTGRSAALNYLALRAIGIDAAVYDGSWLEWSSDESLPIVKGTTPGTP